MTRTEFNNLKEGDSVYYVGDDHQCHDLIFVLKIIKDFTTPLYKVYNLKTGKIFTASIPEQYKEL